LFENNFFIQVVTFVFILYAVFWFACWFIPTDSKHIRGGCSHNIPTLASQLLVRVNVPNVAQVPNWRSLVKTSLELQSCPLFQINTLDQNPLGLLPLVKCNNLKGGHDCSSKDVFTKLRQFETCAK
jgi:hypothetical protein